MTLAPSGHATVTGIIGLPVGHSRSPAIHNAAYRALGLDWVYVAFPVAVGAVRDALVGLRALGAAGCNVTMPHKAEAARACDELDATAGAVAVVNTVVVRDGELRGAVTDGDGFVDAAREAGVELDGARVLLVGAGGSARAVAHALGRAGARVAVAARRPEAACAVAALAPGARPVPWADLDEAVGASDVVVNATPLGMRHEAPPFDAERLSAEQVVVDTVYEPEETPLLAAARARGARALNGLGMLVHQAARSFTLFTGEPAPLEVMRAAARGEA
ncbi:MAG TPA: shikimate dehydrogenase [Acidimicrobiia bacterium]|nr:shikimate dehydrogenase [Acidimicrobiia bacterium]